MGTELGAFLLKLIWAPFVGILGYVVVKRDKKIDALDEQMKETVTHSEAKEMIKDAVQPVREEMSRFQQQMTETNLLVRQISDNLNKLSTEFTVQVRVQEALKKQEKE
mgnify:CR=1 FL=1